MTVLSDSLVADPDRLPRPASAEAAALGLQRWLEAAERETDESIAGFMRAAVEPSATRRLLDTVFGNSPFLTQCLLTDPAFARLLLEDGPACAIEFVHRLIGEEAPPAAAIDVVMRTLRRARRQVALAIALADIGGVWRLEAVTEALTAFGDAAIGAAVAHLLAAAASGGELTLAHADDPQRDSGFVVLGMGKLGARELNYSSDIDLILLFDEERIADSYIGKRSPHEFFVRLARQLVRVLEERTADGYVFRTDLRLRPDPGSTPPVLSMLAAETYYESAGQNWERAAMIKARAVAGDKAAGRRFLEILRPFIWRKSLDFAAIQDIHSIKRQINAHRGGAKIAVAGHNIKLGRGGIREIEFFAQTQQLIWGGREPALRTPRTCEALQALADAGHITPDVPARLTEAYRFLRTLEHRLQMAEDRQTHQLPADPAKLMQVAAFMGFADAEAFGKAVLDVLRTVEDEYAGLFEEAADLGGGGALVFTGGEDHPDTLRTLTDLGFREPSAVSAAVRAWHHGRYRAMRSTRARELLTEIMPALLGAFAKTVDPDAALMRFDDFLKGLPAGVQLFSLLHSNPALLTLLAEIMGSTPQLADTLRRHPILFDAVLTADFFEAPPDAAALTAEMQAALGQARDFQDVLDLLRRHVNDRIFQIGVHILRGRMNPDAAGKPLSDIADVALRALWPTVETAFAEPHGRFEDGDMAIVALGKLGGREMSIGSDLDLLFVYDSGRGEMSDGKRPLPPIQYYTRLGQRLLGALSAPTGEGKLYEVDMRLRPSGNAGPLASSLESFAQYHRESAWTWEHLALTRARIVAAGDGLRDRLAAAIRETLTAPREPERLLRDVADMRARLERDKPATGPWDIKMLRGGLVDCEFVAQYLQLRHAHDDPDVLATNTTEALDRIRGAGLLDGGIAEKLIAAIRLWRNLQGTLRLGFGASFDESTAPDGSKALLAMACGVDDFETLKRTVADTARQCRDIFDDLIEAPAQALGAATPDDR